MNALTLAERALDACRPARVLPTPVGWLSGVRGPFMTARGFACAIGTGAVVDSKIAAEVVGFSGDEAILIGAQGDERILAEEVARRLETINYEVTCGISSRVPRVLS